ncbi:radical SAM protein [Catenuloplanes indicus]|uniref:Radical SAM protein with 4Fe4S-binding SPASM domain n=1 Tax=Catenuloplanes indicus TaxID=137267 RepID=A0AAE3VXP8_9ACTN|nr:radical SAM protein [Catenuloplanes indicus]MDQ0364930.1 radical SAM protein with 4Fe4S-binding SPASM domain [Catenuloplanes indicus]
MPQTTRTLNLKEFADIKHIVSLKSEARKEMQGDSAYAAPLPREVCLQLTYACNLRCTHCYQWSEQGFFRDYSIDKQRTSLDIGIVEDILEMTAPQRSKLFLWGGEPLMYRQFDKVAELLQRYPRTVVMCTNGLLMKRHVKALTAIEDMNILVSLDGLKDDHDALRGSGSFERTTKNIKAMLALRETGEFRGELSLNCMVSHATVHRMYEFMEWAEDLGVNTVYFQFPWYITPEVARAMDRLYAECFEWLGRKPDTTRATWHSYTYRLPPELVPTLRDSMTRLAERTWNIRIRYQPQVGLDDVEDFILGRPEPVQHRSRCLAVSNRMEVHADGNVSSCKFFPEFTVGNLYETPAAELWQSENFRRVRSILAENGMMPICSKCILLYLNGV